MMSLAICAELAYRSATHGREPDEETLNQVARAIAACIEIFECGVRQPHRTPKLLTPEEVRQGHFHGGGSTLHFDDGRPGRINLCIRVSDVSRAIVEINHLLKRTS